ncbi:MAG: ABC transporter substrate-binding protein, partial [Clostridiaceae bacterium]|nr:ABC transporter substrate-binding protein [Clostridiaceae bacterium]
MNKLKRLISIALALVMIASLAACGGTTPASQSPKASDPAAPAPASSEAPQAEEKIKIKFLSLSADDNRNNIREKYIKVNAPKEFPNV